METYSEKMLQALAAENLADAQLNFAKALQSDQNEVLAELGEELIQIGFLEEAREVFDTLQERDPENEEWLLSLGSPKSVKQNYWKLKSCCPKNR